MKKIIAIILAVVLLLSLMISTFASLGGISAFASTISGAEIESLVAMSTASSPDYTYTTGQTHTSLPLEKKFYYSRLNAEDREAYRTMYNAIANLEERCDLTVNISEKHYIYYCLELDCPEFFYLYNLTIHKHSENSYSVIFGYIVDKDNYCSYNKPYTPELKEKIIAKKAIFEEDVRKIVSTIPANAPDYVKERLIYAKILKSSHYNMSAAMGGDNDKDNWSAYGIISNHYGVCESYSEAFQVLCHAVGIENIGVVGTAGGGHKWSMVKIGGQWYQADVTFDDPIGGDPEDAYDGYFNITDEEMGKDHQWNDIQQVDYISLPDCTATQFGREYFRAYHDFGSDNVLHFFASDCDTTCENCDYERDAYGDHTYSGPEDATCEDCGYRRLSGWVKLYDYYEEGAWYYYYDGQPLTNTWKRDSVGWCYLGSNGAMYVDQFGWDDKGQFCVDAAGHCYMNGWFRPDGETWYYADASGYTLRNKWFLWQNKWYYFYEWGGMAYDTWQSDSGGECYLSPSGAMVTNSWVQWGDWYFVDSSGHKLKNTWKKDSKGWVYLGADGRMKTNAWVRDSKGWCYVGQDGYCVTNRWQSDSTGNMCYLNSNGNMVTNDWVYDNKWHYNAWFYMDANGYRVKGTKVIGGKTHFFDSYGLWKYEIK